MDLAIWPWKEIIFLFLNMVLTLFLATWVSGQGKIFDSNIIQLNAIKITLVEFGNRIHYIANERSSPSGKDLIEECRKANMAENEIGIVLSDENPNKEALRQHMRNMLNATCRLKLDFSEDDFLSVSDQSKSETDIIGLSRAALLSEKDIIIKELSVPENLKSWFRRVLLGKTFS